MVKLDWPLRPIVYSRIQRKPAFYIHVYVKTQTCRSAVLERCARAVADQCTSFSLRRQYHL